MVPPQLNPTGLLLQPSEFSPAWVPLPRVQLSLSLAGFGVGPRRDMTVRVKPHFTTRPR